MNMYKEYATLRAKTLELKARERELEPHIIQAIGQEGESKTLKTEYGDFTKVTNKWEYSEKLTAKIQKLKAREERLMSKIEIVLAATKVEIARLQKKEQEDGVAKESAVSLRYSA